MSNCTRCGAALGLGRYCTNCGARAEHAARAEPPSEHPATAGDPDPATAPPPPMPLPGAGSRFPMYADEVAAAPAEPSPPAGRTPLGAPTHRHDRRRGGAWPVLLLVAVVLVAGLGTWALVTGDEGSDGDRSGTGATDDAATSTGPSTGPTGAPRDLTPGVEVDAPRAAPPGQDFSGQRVTYPTGNMFDGRPDTAYRVTGDAAGEVITFTLPETSTVTMVGLVNGYAKTDRDPASGREIDWYPRQHRITEVAWVFDDGSRFEQSLRLTREMQQLAVSVRTRTIELHVLETRAPEDLPRARNATSISEVTLQGS